MRARPGIRSDSALLEEYQQRRDRVRVAIMLLETARDELRQVGARQARAAVARALKSAQGAARHADGMASHLAILRRVGR